MSSVAHPNRPENKTMERRDPEKLEKRTVAIMSVH